MYSGVIVASELERAMNPRLHEVKRDTLDKTMREFQIRTCMYGYWIRQHKGRRRKPRLITAVEWVHPDDYQGPSPGHGGLLKR